MTVEVRGIPVNYISLGEGPETVLILQGWGTNASLYKDLAAHLGQTMRVFVPELPGFGATPEPPEETPTPKAEAVPLPISTWSTVSTNLYLAFAGLTHIQWSCISSRSSSSLQF